MPTFPIVGAHFRPPAKGICNILPAGAKLWLKPEPSNPYDANAIQVLWDVEEGTNADKPDCVSYDELSDAISGYGFTVEDLPSIAHLGYIPKEIAKTYKLPPEGVPGAFAFTLGGGWAVRADISDYGVK